MYTLCETVKNRSKQESVFETKNQKKNRMFDHYLTGEVET